MPLLVEMVAAAPTALVAARGGLVAPEGTPTGRPPAGRRSPLRPLCRRRVGLTSKVNVEPCRTHSRPWRGTGPPARVSFLVTRAAAHWGSYPTAVSSIVTGAPVASDEDEAWAFSPYETFVHEVMRRQLIEWLPAEPLRLLDLSTRCPQLIDEMVSSGHDVIHAGARVPYQSAGHLHPVVADPRRLEWVADRSVDAVIAEGSVLSTALATEVTASDVWRVLRPGGRMLLAVDSLLFGLSQLAGQARWAELADVPAADVVLIPSADGSMTRCFWPEELQALLIEAGFDVEWVRPRTVLAEETVTRALQFDPRQLPSLVDTELRLAVERQGESIGAQLIASAVRR